MSALRSSVITALLFVTVASCTFAGEASAESFESTRTTGLSERASHERLRFGHDHVELVVQRSVFNSANISDQATWFVDLPTGAVATALRTRSVGSGPQRWFTGELLEAEKAAALYQKLTGLGGFYPKDPALLSWRDQSLLALQVFPCPAHAEKVVEYTLAMPTEYREGAYHVQLPALTTESQYTDLHVAAIHPEDRLLVDGVPVRQDAIVLNRANGLDVALVPAAAALEVDLVSLPVATGRVLTRFAIRAAPQLSRVPEHAYLVIVIDGSRSVDSEFEAAAKVALDAYLSHFVDARVEIMTFDRSTTRVLGRFEGVPEARRALSTLGLARRNGSDVARALYEADQLLAASTPPGSPRRIVLVTDGLVQSSLTGERLRGALAQSNALVHIGLLGSGSASLSRNDEHPWAAALRSRHALVWSASAPSAVDSEETPSARSVYEEWARPTRIDNLGTFSDNQGVADRVESDGLLTSLAEGSGVQDLYLERRSTRTLNVSGELWLEPVRTVATASAEHQPLWAGLVFGSPVLDELVESEMMPLALLGHAVSPVTSYLAIEPGVRPSTEGLEPAVSGYGHGASGVSLGRSIACSLGANMPELDRRGYLENELAAESRRCGAAAHSYALDIETTRAEVVHVDAIAQTDARNPLVESCLTEAAWALELPVGFKEDWEDFRIEL